MRITDHAYDRAKERCGWNKATLDRMTKKALDYGISHKNVMGSLRKWIDYVYLSHCNANGFKIYGEWLFLFKTENHFQNETLITIYQIPNKYKNTIHKMKEKERES